MSFLILKIITRLSIAIIISVIGIFMVALLYNPVQNNNEEMLGCGTYDIDPIRIEIDNKIHYKDAVKLIHSDFDPDYGKKLFEANCTTCHAIYTEIVGPPLLGLLYRRDKDWILSFLKNSNKLISSGEVYSTALKNKYGGNYNHTDTAFSKKDLTDLMGFIGMFK